jgi:hypothetical protein
MQSIKKAMNLFMAFLFNNLLKGLCLGYYHPKIQAKIKGATMVASLSTINLGV